MDAPQGPAFLVVNDPVGGRSITPLTPGQHVAIGRAPTNTVVIHDERASRFHAEVFPTSRGWMVRDLESRNSTHVNGQAIAADHLLASGDTIAIGHATLVYGEGDTPTAQTVSAERPAAISTPSSPPPVRRPASEGSEMAGRSAAILAIREQIGRVAATKATVLVRGESGTGKELVGRAIHEASDRRGGPFVCLNCAALSETLLESELFGHEKGAFTGATDRKIGKFEAAHSGTLVLDEIGEMSPAIQAKFLRVLEGHPFERVGGSTRVQADVRVVAATNRDLEAAVTAGGFRRDLYFRLKVVEILVPPLRRRPEDIAVLAMHFLERFAAETGRRLRGFTPAAMEALEASRWPGNIRELRNCVERAVVLAQREWIDIDDVALTQLPVAGDTGKVAASAGPFTPMSIEEMERRHVLATLEAVGGNKTKAAAILGIERSTLDRKLAKWARV
jgi:DNA-binding NtrC family response regulator